ncbi:MAG TPA: hypothetical protein VIT41_01710 [Microlunatus sp.]
MIKNSSAGGVGIRPSTRQLWVLRAVASGLVGRDPQYGGLCTLDGRAVGWTVAVLALRGLVAFDVDAFSRPHLTRRGQTRLDAW